MVTLINNSRNYAVTDQSTNLKLIGEATCVIETAKITTFNGHFETLEGQFVGNFNYGEDAMDKSNKNVYNVDKDKFKEADEMLNDCIDELKEVLNDNE